MNITTRVNRLETKSAFGPPPRMEPDPVRTKLVLDLINGFIREPWNASEAEINAIEETMRVRIDRLYDGFDWVGEPRPEYLVECPPPLGYHVGPRGQGDQGVLNANPSGGRDTGQTRRRRAKE